MTSLRSRLARLSRLDRMVGATLALAVIAISGTLAIGDNVGVRVTRYGPVGTGAQTSWVSMQFSEEMDKASVESRFSMEPGVQGDFSWNGSRMIFKPKERLSSHKTYTVELKSGALSSTGREVLKDFSFKFNVRGPKLVYNLLGADGFNNVWITDPADPTSARQLTFSENGVLDFAMSPDGRRLAYTEIDPKDFGDTATKLMVLDLETSAVEDLTGDTEAQISDPAWSPDGTKLAYTKIDFSLGIPGVDQSQSLGYSLPRVWVADLAQDPPVTQRLLQSEDGASFDPVWSPSGDAVAVGNEPVSAGSSRRIAISKISAGDVFYVTTTITTSATFNGLGDQMLYIANTGPQFDAPTELHVATVDSQDVRTVETGSDQPVRDDAAEWRPDSDWVAVSRNGYGDKATRGGQPFLVNIVTGETKPIYSSPEFDVESMTWSPAGDLLALVRLHRWKADGATPTTDVYRELLIYNPDTGDLTPVARGSSKPAWAP